MWQPSHYDLNNSSKYLDYINVMCYDMSNANGQYQNALHKSTSFNDPTNKVGNTLTSCSIEESVNIYKNTYGVLYNKLIIGVPFYGRQQILSNNSWIAKKAITYNNLKKSYLSNPNYNQVFDNIAKVPYLLSKDGTEFISYENELSIKYKCEYIKTNKLAGMMYWANYHDSSNTLLNEINTYMK